MIPIFSEAYNLKNLVSLNARGRNFEEIDLRVRALHVAFQITSKTDNKKIKKMLRSIVENEYYANYDKFIIYDLTTKQNSYSGAGRAEIIDGKFTFDKLNYHKLFLKRIIVAFFANLCSASNKKITD